MDPARAKELWRGLSRIFEPSARGQDDRARAVRMRNDFSEQRTVGPSWRSTRRILSSARPRSSMWCSDDGDDIETVTVLDMLARGPQKATPHPPSQAAEAACSQGGVTRLITWVADSPIIPRRRSAISVCQASQVSSSSQRRGHQ